MIDHMNPIFRTPEDEHPKAIGRATGVDTERWRSVQINSVRCIPPTVIGVEMTLDLVSVHYLLFDGC